MYVLSMQGDSGGQGHHGNMHVLRFQSLTRDPCNKQTNEQEFLPYNSKKTRGDRRALCTTRTKQGSPREVL